MRSEFPGAVPEIPVQSIAAAAAYYHDSLGFTVDWSEEELGLAGWRVVWNQPTFQTECWMIAGSWATEFDILSPSVWRTEARAA